MRTEAMFLGLDLGTTNVKALVTDDRGTPLARGSCPVQLFRMPGGGVEQDLEEIWQATIAAIRQVGSNVDATRILAIGVSSQGGAMQVLDDQGRPRGRVISWLDQRGRPFDVALTNELGKDWFLARIVHGGSWLSIGQVLRLRQANPDCLQPPNRIGFVGDIVLSRLCGSPAHDGTSAALTLLYNPPRRDYDADLLAKMGVTPAQLPPLLAPRRVAGRLLPEVARQTGLPPGIPISPAVHDQYASALGVGATAPGTVMVGTGTAWVLLHVTGSLPTPATEEAFVCHHLIDGLWGQILSMVNGGSAVTWALELTGQSKDGASIDKILAATAPGSDGVSFWPFLTPFGASGLAPGTRGRLAGLQLHHTAPHVVRAVVEGLGYELNRYLELLKSRGQVERLVMAGGAASSSVTPQMLSDIAGLPLRCFAGSDAALAGAAILARGLIEPERSLVELSRDMAAPARDVSPGPNRSLYQAEFKRYVESIPVAFGTIQ